MDKNKSSMITYALWITILILWMSPPSSSLRCYVCNSINDKNCMDLSGDEYLIDCQNATEVDSDKNYTNCRKQAYTAESVAYEWKVERVVRSCGIEKHSKYACFYSSTLDLKSTTCECVEDGCNIGQNVSADITILSSLIMFVLLFVT